MKSNERPQQTHAELAKQWQRAEEARVAWESATSIPGSEEVIATLAIIKRDLEAQNAALTPLPTFED